MLIVEKLPWGNTKDITEGVEAALPNWRPKSCPGGDRYRDLPPGDLYRYVDRQFEQRVAHCLCAGNPGAVHFPFRMAVTLISCVAIPCHRDGRGLWCSTFRGDHDQHHDPGGIRDCLGAVVDDAIVDVENIMRRLREAKSGAKFLLERLSWMLRSRCATPSSFPP